MTVKICILGNTGVGKTTLRNVFIYKKFDIPQMRLGVDFGIKEVCYNGEPVKLVIWDVLSHSYFHERMKIHLKGAKGYLLVFDLTNRKSFESINDLLSKIEEHLRSRAASIQTTNILLVGNKKDLMDSRVIMEEEIRNFLKNKPIKEYIEVSCKTGENVEAVFMNLTSHIMKSEI